VYQFWAKKRLNIKRTAAQYFSTGSTYFLVTWNLIIFCNYAETTCCKVERNTVVLYVCWFDKRYSQTLFGIRNFLGVAALLVIITRSSTAGASRATAGPRETFSRGPKHFHRDPLGRKFLNFFQMVHSGVLFEFLADGGAPQTSQGPGVANPLYPTLSMGLQYCR